MSYGALARALGVGAAARAVGAANGRNPISLVVPCHRLIGGRRRADRLRRRALAEALAAAPRGRAAPRGDG